MRKHLFRLTSTLALVLSQSSDTSISVSNRPGRVIEVLQEAWFGFYPLTVSVVPSPSLRETCLFFGDFEEGNLLMSPWPLAQGYVHRLGTSPQSAAVTDTDDDGLPDVVIVGGGGVTVVLAAGMRPTLPPVAESSLCEFNLLGLAVGKISSQDRPVIVATSVPDSGVYLVTIEHQTVCLNKYEWRDTPPSIARPLIATVREGKGNELLLFGEDGVFVVPWEGGALGAARLLWRDKWLGASTADTDGDGASDVAFVRDRQICLLTQQGRTERCTSRPAGQVRFITVGKFGNRGEQFLVFGLGGAVGIAPVTNRGRGLGSIRVSEELCSWMMDGTLADLDQDGIPELVVVGSTGQGRSSSSNVWVLRVLPWTAQIAP